MDVPVKLSVPLPDILEEVDGEYKVKGHRITLYHILSAYNEHWVGPHAMVFYYPTLSLNEIEKVLAFYHANQEAVLDYAKRYRAELDRLEASLPRGPSRAELVARFEARRREQTAPSEAG